jgi:thiosulfate sulfurtransferase
MNIPEINIAEAQCLLEDESATFVDVRDSASYQQAHIPGAMHLDNSSVQAFLNDTDKAATVVVYCYHGNSSMGATAFLQEQGFTAVASMSGGFTAWEGAGGPSQPTTSS